MNKLFYLGTVGFILLIIFQIFPHWTRPFGYISHLYLRLYNTDKCLEIKDSASECLLKLPHSDIKGEKKRSHRVVFKLPFYKKTYFFDSKGLMYYKDLFYGVNDPRLYIDFTTKVPKFTDEQKKLLKKHFKDYFEFTNHDEGRYVENIFATNDTLYVVSYPLEQLRDYYIYKGKAIYRSYLDDRPDFHLDTFKLEVKD